LASLPSIPVRMHRLESLPVPERAKWLPIPPGLSMGLAEVLPEALLRLRQVETEARGAEKESRKPEWEKEPEKGFAEAGPSPPVPGEVEVTPPDRHLPPEPVPEAPETRRARAPEAPIPSNRELPSVRRMKWVWTLKAAAECWLRN